MPSNTYSLLAHAILVSPSGSSPILNVGQRRPGQRASEAALCTTWGLHSVLSRLCRNGCTRHGGGMWKSALCLLFRWGRDGPLLHTKFLCKDARERFLSNPVLQGAGLLSSSCCIFLIGRASSVAHCVCLLASAETSTGICCFLEAMYYWVVFQIFYFVL